MEKEEWKARLKARLRMGWTKDSLTKDTNKRPIHPEESTAVCWCLVGGMCAENLPLPECGRIYAAVEKRGWKSEGWRSPVDTSVEDVLAVIDEA